MGPRQKYFDRPRQLSQLEITLSDGRTVTVVSDGAWKHRFGPLLDNDLLMGEAYDARLEMPGWDEPGYDDSRWHAVELFGDPGTALAATNGPAVRRIEELQPAGDPIGQSDVERKRDIFDLG